MVKSVIPGMILIVAIPSALINEALGGAYSLSLALWAVAGTAIFATLASAYDIGSEIDKIGGVGHKRTVRSHVLLHVIPLTYFPVASSMVSGRVLEAIYLIPVIVFFITGVRTWKLCHDLLGTGLYRLFQIGNLQMLFFFPVAFALDLVGWPTEEAKAFSNLMRGYFTVHFMLTGITVPLMERDLRRYTTGSPLRNESDAL